MRARPIATVGMVSLVVVTLIVSCGVWTSTPPPPDSTPTGVSSPSDSRMAATLAADTASYTPGPPHTSAPATTPTRTAIPIPTVTPMFAHTPGPTETRGPAATTTSTSSPIPTATNAPTTTPTHTPTATPNSTAPLTSTATTASSFSGEVGAIAKINLELAKQIAGFGWVADGVAGDDWIPLAITRGIATTDLQTARLMMNAPWVADSITLHERQGMSAIGAIAENDPEVARLAFSRPFMDPPFQHRDALALWGLFWLVNFSSEPTFDFTAMVANQPWFQDGVDDLEATLLKVLETCTNKYMRALIESHHIESTRVHLPLARDVDLVAIRHAPSPPETAHLSLWKRESGPLKDSWGHLSLLTT